MMTWRVRIRCRHHSNVTAAVTLKAVTAVADRLSFGGDRGADDAPALVVRRTAAPPPATTTRGGGDGDDGARPDGALEALLRRCHELLIAPVAAHLEAGISQ